MLLLWLLLVLCWQPTASASAFALDSQHIYSFEDLSAGNGTLPASKDVRTLPGVSECQCRMRCLSESTCRGYGYSDNTTSCLLTKLLPTPLKMEASSEDWRWHARNGVRLLGEPCTADWDCSLLVPAATCVKNVCGCHSPVEEDGAGGCRKVGSFIEVSDHQLTSGLLSEMPQTSIDTCKASCAGNLSCVAFDFDDTAEGRCRMYAKGVTAEVGPSPGVQSYVWSFARPDGTPLDSYKQVGGSYLGLLSEVTGVKAADACFADNAILFPGVTSEELAPLVEFLASTERVWIGLEDMLEEGHYVTSNGRNASNIAWGKDEPTGITAENCILFLTETHGLHDASCEREQFALCQYVGENLALGKPAWMNAQDLEYPAYNGNDGNVSNLVHTPRGGKLYPTPTWTVDLGGSVQVTSVLYVACADCCDNHDLPNLNRLTEIRVGSDSAGFDEQHSARCVWLEQPFVARGYARLFRCAVPLTGRYVRLIRDKQQPIVDFAELAVFGNRLRAP